jgi:hypothetical protein
LAAFSGQNCRAGQLQYAKNEAAGVIAELKPEQRLDPEKPLSLTLGLSLRNPEELEQLLRDLYTPSSPNYRKYLTADQFTERFCPSKADYQAVIDFARANGLRVTGRHPNRLLLNVEAKVADIERAFHVVFQTYQHPTENRKFYAPDTDPSFELPVTIKGIGGLTNFAPPRPHYRARSGGAPMGTNGAGSPAAAPNAGSGPGGTYAGGDFRAAYAPGSALVGAAQTLALVEFDGYDAQDITYYENAFGLPNLALTNVLLDGFSGTPTGSGGEVEVCLDIQVAIALSPGLASLVVYEGGPNGSWHTMLNRIATDNLAKQISCSWYSPGASADHVADQIFQQMAAQGQSFYIASGDSDAYTGLIPFPCDTPFATQVGGSTLTTSGPGGPWQSETAWNWGEGLFGPLGTGGGISTQYSIPYWQQGIAMGPAKGSTLKRNVPDVAMVADNVYVRANRRDYYVGGTSCAAPLWAAFTALVNQQAMSGPGAVGFLNPALYSISRGSNYSANFHDTVTGNNFSSKSPGKFPAVAGYDLCTGLGTPAGQPLIEALAGQPDLLEVSPTAFNPLGVSGGPFRPESATYTLTNSGTTPLQWVASPTRNWLALSATTGLLAEGAATEVTVTLASAADHLTNGSYFGAISFSNLGTGIVQTRPAILTVKPLPPEVTSPGVAYALMGSSFRYRITAINRPTRFAAQGLPADLRVNSTSGVIAGVPQATGTFSILLVASNAQGSGTAGLQLSINALPNPSTRPATGVSTKVATLRAIVNPNGAPATVKFEYGTSSTLSNPESTAERGLESGTAGLELLQAVSGLSPGTRYYFRVTASNATGSVAGGILSFVTPTSPLIPVLLPSLVQAVSDDSACLGARVNPRGAETMVYFEYGPTTAYGLSSPPQEAGSGNANIFVGTSISGLSPGATYHYRVVLVSALGTFFGPDQVLTTQIQSGLFAIASKDDPAPGIPNAQFASFGVPAINDLGHAAFQAVVKAIPGTEPAIHSGNNAGIWAEIGQGDAGLVVRTGDPVPGIPNAAFTYLSDPVFNNQDRIAFFGTTVLRGSGTLGGTMGGIWLAENGALNLVIGARAQAPGCPPGARFASFPQIVLPDQGGVVFVANLVASERPSASTGGVVAGNNQGIWAVNTAGELQLVVRKGDAQVINGVRKTIAGLSIFAPARFSFQQKGYNSPGDLVFRIRFTDGSQTVEKAIFP